MKQHDKIIIKQSDVNIIIASKKNRWFFKLKSILKLDNVNIIYHTDPKSLSNLIYKVKPSWIFFFHWSNIVPKEIYEHNRCVVLHTGILPEHRGGSPIQNQIMDGIVSTYVNAIVMQEPLDSGDIYAKLKITLQGTLNDIWSTITHTAADLIKKCVIESPNPIPQVGEVNVYKRKTNNTLIFDNIESIYNQIRMLDGDGYPSSNLIIGDFLLEFSRANMFENYIISDVKITNIKNKL